MILLFDKKISFLSFLVLAFFGVWVSLMLTAEPSPKGQWLSSKAKEATQNFLREFCEEINRKNEGSCSNIRIFGKQYWGASGSIYLSAQLAEQTLLDLGWTKSEKSDESHYFYCKQEYTAQIDPKHGYIKDISFLGGSYNCAIE